MKLEEVSEILCEYGEAIRGDWGSIDGRSERSSIQTFADAILCPEDYDAVKLRDHAGICPKGLGHWEYHCDEECETES